MHHGIHARADLLGFQVAYGTAILARDAMEDRASLAFERGWRDTKGFVVATVRGPGGMGAVDVVSVHTDFLSAQVRAAQIAMVVEVLKARGRPLIVMGDLNSEWSGPNSGVAHLAAALNLHAFAPEVQAGTFPADSPKRRLDWILISKGLAFAHHEVLEDVVSDHRPVLADIRMDVGGGTAPQEE